MKKGLAENFQTFRGLFPIIIKTEAIEATHNYQLIFLHKAAGSITASFMRAVMRFSILLQRQNQIFASLTIAPK